MGIYRLNENLSVKWEFIGSYNYIFIGGALKGLNYIA